MDTEEIKRRLSTHPTPVGDADAVGRAIAATLACAQATVFCADACLAEAQDETLALCIRRCLDCADVCELTGRMLSRQYEPDMQLLRASLELCGKAADVCASECEIHAGRHEHCLLCSEACRRCQEICNELLAALR